MRIAWGPQLSCKTAELAAAAESVAAAMSLGLAELPAKYMFRLMSRGRSYWSGAEWALLRGDGVAVTIVMEGGHGGPILWR